MAHQARHEAPQSQGTLSVPLIPSGIGVFCELPGVWGFSVPTKAAQYGLHKDTQMSFGKGHGA